MIFSKKSTLSKVSYPPQDLENLLDGLTLPKLTNKQVDMLEAPLSTDDIKLALSHFAKAKAPGSDVLPIDFYVHFSDVLVPRLLALYQAIFKAASLPESMREPIIFLSLKPDKDPLLPESYRPISLLQTDIKILAKILALRLN